MALKSAWTTAPLGRMAPIEQAKLWAIRAVLVDQGEAADQYQRMSRFVVKVGGGHPDRHVVKKFFARVDKDPLGWYPGKAAGQLLGVAYHVLLPHFIGKMKIEHIASVFMCT